MFRRVLLGSAMLAFAAGAAAAQHREVKIGFVTTLSSALAAVGNDMRDAFELALDHLGHKMSGLPVHVFYEDDGLKPEVGKQKTDKLIESEQVNFLTGYIQSHILLASLKSAVELEYVSDQRKRRPFANRRRTLLTMVLLVVLAGRPGAASGRRVHESKERKDRVPDCAKLRRWQRRPGRCESQLSWSDPGRGLYQMAGPARLFGGVVESARNQTGRNLRFLSRSGRYPIFDAILAIWSARSNTPLYRLHHRCAFSAAIR